MEHRVQGSLRYPQRANEIQHCILRERREAAPQRAWGRGRDRVLMPMGGRRSASAFQCLACIAYAQHYDHTSCLENKKEAEDRRQCSQAN